MIVFLTTSFNIFYLYGKKDLRKPMRLCDISITRNFKVVGQQRLSTSDTFQKLHIVFHIIDVSKAKDNNNCILSFRPPGPGP